MHLNAPAMHSLPGARRVDSLYSTAQKGLDAVTMHAAESHPAALTVYPQAAMKAAVPTCLVGSPHDPSPAMSSHAFTSRFARSCSCARPSAAPGAGHIVCTLQMLPQIYDALLYDSCFAKRVHSSQTWFKPCLLSKRLCTQTANVERYRRECSWCQCHQTALR